MDIQAFTKAESIILAIDTSSKATSLAVARGAKLLGSIIESPTEKRSETLWIEIRSLLSKVGMTLSDVDVFGVCVGPGGFTGLRVGMAAIKGFSVATNKPVIGITSLEAVAYSAAGSRKSVCAMVNAYKDEVYSQLFSFDDDGIPVASNEPMVSRLKEAFDRVSDVNDLVFAGDAVDNGFINSFPEFVNNRKWRVMQSGEPLAGSVSGLTYLKNARGMGETAETLRACYVRQSEAEIKLSLGLLGSKIKRSMKSE